MDMTAAEQIELIELSIESAREKVAMATSLRRLYKNKDFKKVFLDYFLGTDVSRTVKALAEPACQDPNIQRALQKRIDAVGQLDQFMRMTERIGDTAAKALVDDEETREAILRDEAEA